MKIKDKILSLMEQIKVYDKAYWIDCNPLISDELYNKLVKEYKALLKLNNQEGDYEPGFIDDELYPVEIKEPMLSIDKFKTVEECERKISKLGNDVTIEDKYDGVAVRLTYNDGLLARLNLRGTGVVGGDVSHRLYLISGIPDTIPSSNEEDFITGEVLPITEEYLSWCKKYDVPITRDARAVVAGMLRRLEPKDDEDLPLYFIPYHGSQSIRNKCQDYPAMISLFKGWNFEYFPKSYDSLPSEKPTSIYPIDGIVFKSNKLSDWNNQSTTGYYSYAGCFKYPTDVAQTTVESVTWGLTTQGEIVGTLNFKPTLLTNKLASKCKFNYPVEYIQQGISKGSVISFTIANEIIPHMLSLDKIGTGDKIEFPKECPECEETLDFSSDIPKCINHQCPGMLANRLERLLGKKGLDIQGLGEKKIILLVENNLVIYPYQIFQLTDDDLVHIGISKKVSKNIIKQIEQVKEQPLAVWLYGLSIPRLGKGRCLEIQSYMTENHFDNAEQLTELLCNKDVMCDMFGIDGLKVCSYVSTDYENILSFLNNYDFTKQLNNLIELKPVVLTGSWLMVKDRLESLLKPKGYQLTGTVTKSTYKLLIGIKPSANKIQLAERYEIPSYDISQATLEELFSILEK